MRKFFTLFLVAFFGTWSLFAQKPVSKADWSLVDVDSEEVTGETAPATYAFDGDPGTFWHTNWSTTGDPYPHHITIDMGDSYDMIGFQLTPRSGNTFGVPDTFSFWTSVDNVTWDSVAGGKWEAPYNVIRTEAFTSTGQYIKLIGHSGQGDYAHMVVAEIDVLVSGADFTADQTLILRGESVSFTDLSGNSPVAWKWEFEGGNPATSTDQHPVVTYDQAGNYDVTLISIPDAGDPTKNDTTTSTNYITVDIPNVSQEGWSILYVDSENPSEPAANIIDGDPETFWHDNWPDGNRPPYPHTIIIDLGANFEMEGFSYAPRPGGGNGTIKGYQVYFTKEEPSTTLDASWETAVAEGEWSGPWDVTRNEFLAQPKIGRYFIFYMLSEAYDNAYNASGSELNIKGSLYGAAFTANKTNIYASQKVTFADKSSGLPAAWKWSFPGGDPATSTDQNPVVTYAEGGTYDVELIMTPQSGTDDNDTLVKAGYINVQATPTSRSLAKDDWEVLVVSSEETVGEDGAAANAIDGDPSTFWHTQWYGGEPGYPHEMIIDLGENKELVGFEYVPRPGGGNGTIAQYELLTSIDAELFDLADSGTWVDNWAETRTQLFEAPVTARFIKFVAIAEKNGNAWASCGELNMLEAITGVEFMAEKTWLEKGEPVSFIDFSAGDPTGWTWTFEGGTPATSNEQSPEGVVYNELGTYSVTLTTTGGTSPGSLTKTELITVDYAIPPRNYIGVYVDTVEFGKVLASYSTMDWGPTYVDHTENPFHVYRGETYQLKVRHWNGWDDPNYKYQRVWIDWDGSGRLDDDELVLDGIEPLNVTIPADAALGAVRMRVVARWNEPVSLSAQEAITDGEVEDYTMVIGELSAEVPVAGFEADTIEGCAGGFVVQYKDLSANTPTEWSWTFEGGTPATSDLQNPVVVYEAAGTYDASLTASQPSGSDDETQADYITVHALPTVSGGSDLTACFGEEITLAGSGADTYTWDKGVTDGVAFVPTAGEYAVWGTDVNGCMNTDTITITVTAEIDASVTATETTLTANSAEGTFQWIDCADDSEVAGATASVFTPTETGNYAVVVTVGDCSATSDCFTITVTGVEQNAIAGMVNVYPNPSTGKVNVALETTGAMLKVYDITGSVILERLQSSDVEQIELATKGMYILRVESEGAVYTGKLVIE